jgi:hypothetical protein
MDAPFLSLFQDAYLWFMPILSVAYVTAMMQLRIVEEHLHRPILRNPIVDWQMAGTNERLTAIKNAWGTSGRTQAAFTLFWDYGFLVAYGFGLALACSIGAAAFADFGWECVAAAASVIAWGALVAAVLDAIENLLLFWSLTSDVTSDAIPATTRVVAKVKFFLVLRLAVPVALVSIGVDLLGCRFGCVR